MSNLKRFLSSSIGRKFVMATTGLMLVGFLIIHLLGNLVILFGDDQGVAFNDYGHFLMSLTPWIWIAEIGLLAVFVVHIANAVMLHKQNRTARPEGYYGFGMAGHTSRKTFASGTMIRSGILVALFVAIHLWGFKFGEGISEGYVASHDPEVRDLYRLTLEKFSDVFYVIVYCAFMLLLGFHLWHGIASAFQTLGLHHRTGLQKACQGLAALIAGGFILIPIYVYFFKNVADVAKS